MRSRKQYIPMDSLLIYGFLNVMLSSKSSKADDTQQNHIPQHDMKIIINIITINDNNNNNNNNNSIFLSVYQSIGSKSTTHTSNTIKTFQDEIETNKKLRFRIET
ncbi:hypothetical protein QQ045_000051 [Rhodiola kirilowii]